MTHTSQSDENFFGAIGRFILSWAQLETVIDIMVMMIHHGLGGKTEATDLPRALNRRLDYLKERAADIPAIQPIAVEIIEFVEEARAMGERRHDIVHGTTLDLPEGCKGEIEFMRFLKKADIIKVKYSKTSSKVILKLAIRTNKLVTQSLVLANFMKSEAIIISTRHDAPS